jgi:hypothetical protein
LAKRGQGRFFDKNYFHKIPLSPPFPKGEVIIFFLKIDSMIIAYLSNNQGTLITHY